MKQHHSIAVAMAVAVFTCSTAAINADQTWMATGGETTIILDQSSLTHYGLTLTQASMGDDGQQLDALVLSHDAKSDLTLLTTGRNLIEISRGHFSIPNDITISTTQVALTLQNLIVNVEPGLAGGAFSAIISSPDTSEPLFILSNGKASFTNESIGRFFEVRGAAVEISGHLAKQLGNADLEGAVIGRFDARSDVEFAGGDEEPPVISGGEDDGTPRLPGPDVIVGGLGVSGFNGSNPNDVVGYGPVGALRAYSFATTSCNIGTSALNWMDCGQPSNPVCAHHPVISQNLYRLKNGRFEQLGQSWLKHGFCALDETYCSPSCPGDGCDFLGVGCSDPYTASRNAGPSLGRKSDVNAFTAVFPYPFSNGSNGSTPIHGRLQVRNDDVNPSLNAGALYWGEGQYNAQDDAAAGNADNNASHRRVTFNASFAMSCAAPTVQQLPAIREWKVNDPSVVETNIRVPNEGLMILAAKSSDNGNGTWHYEYALFNQNSDRSARAFSVPVDGATITNIGFTDVDYHSGEPYSLANWTTDVTGGVLTWSAETFAQNVNANALRWGTMYNFRFDANVPPSPVNDNITVGLFKPGTPTSVTATTIVPAQGALSLTLATQPPTDYMAPCAAISFNVNIQPITDTLAPGGALLNYSYDGGPMQTLPLVSLGGTLYRADLPPAACGDDVRFYVSAQGTQGDFVYLPNAAPAVAYEPAVGAAGVFTEVDEDFSAGLPEGWTATGLWNVTSSCPVIPANCSAGQFAYYGQPDTCNYDIGGPTTGKLSFTVSIPADASNAELRYCSNFKRENAGVADWPAVKIGLTTIDQPAQGGVASSLWVERVATLNGFLGQTVTIDFEFAVTNATNNANLGWQIDNVKVNVVGVECTAGTPGDLDGNSIVDGGDITEFTTAALAMSTLPQHVCPGDFNADGMVSPLDAQGFADMLINLP